MTYKPRFFLHYTNMKSAEAARKFAEEHGMLAMRKGAQKSDGENKMRVDSVPFVYRERVWRVKFSELSTVVPEEAVEKHMALHKVKYEDGTVKRAVYSYLSVIKDAAQQVWCEVPQEMLDTLRCMPHTLTHGGQSYSFKVMLVMPPEVRVCWNCGKRGHTKFVCREEEKCARCGERVHAEVRCEKKAKCLLCGGEHCMRECPKGQVRVREIAEPCDNVNEKKMQLVTRAEETPHSGQMVRHPASE